MEIIPIPAVNVAVINLKGEILLTRRSSKVREPGKWVLPGGHVEYGENWEIAAQRELQEETGLLVRDLIPIGLYSDPALTVSREVLPEGYRGQFVVVLFLAKWFEGEVKPNDEVDDWGWYDKKELPAPLLKSNPIRVQDAFSFKGEIFLR